MDRVLNRLLKLIAFLFNIILIIYLFPKIKVVILAVFKFLFPFIVSFMIAFLLNPLVDKLEMKKIKRSIASIVILGILLFIFFLIMYLFIPELIEEGKKFLDNLPTYLENINVLMKKICTKLKINSENYQISTQNIIDFIQHNFNDFFSKVIVFFQSIFSYITLFGVIVVLTLYFLIDYHLIINYLQEKLIYYKKENVISKIKIIEKSLRNYFKGIIYVMVFMIIISTLFFLIMKIDLAFLLGLIIGITNIIPYIGPLIGGFIVLFIVFCANPKKAISVLLFIVIIQFIESNFITPKIESNSLKVHPIIIIFFVTLLGSLFGFIGMVFTIPILLILKMVKNGEKNN